MKRRMSEERSENETWEKESPRNPFRSVKTKPEIEIHALSSDGRRSTF